MTVLPIGKAVSLFSLAAALIVAGWWRLGSPVDMPASPRNPDEKLYCLSYAPFHGAQTPTDPATLISPGQIDEDLAQLAALTDCIRTYSVDFGLDYVPQAARKHGLKVLLGVWLSSRPERNQFQITTGIALAKQYPDVIRALIVGNETLLRGEISAAALADTLRAVKAQVQQPVTYADVWEFWLRNRELAGAVDFVTIHILPYWEDFPIAADHAADHVASIRKRAVAEFPGKEIVIGETGWPSAGRMREGALPSRANQARVIQDILVRGKQENFRVNIIEAYDQPWKRFFEGTVGGHWGLLDDATRRFKFSWGAPVSNHPAWRWQALGGVALAGIIFGAAIAARRRSSLGEFDGRAWLIITTSATIAGILSGWAVENATVESLGIGGWLRSLALVAIAIAGPVACAAVVGRGVGMPSFDQILAAPEDRVRDPVMLGVGLVSIVICLLAMQAALGLAFDPRYRDFPFAPLTSAVAPFLLLKFSARPTPGPPAIAERVAACVLAPSALYIMFNETLANWQALWLGAVLILLAISLARVRAAPG
jgi:exo-beta-1,3-glucanase (GH17 family)